ncbi:hypothetical protein HPB48_013989 [Haemaphysalis longicornis]|uniref:Uncharacterized protein n=1 Tax=Haemaphysalis longicornis TaxID=44386 RepID=A0A9J6G841_HAELO|nr:hypothetical protein HPB48_013989 [Haemaphysalis longicornis]
MAVQMLAAAWMSTRGEVVKNCFTHAGFRPEEMCSSVTMHKLPATLDRGKTRQRPKHGQLSRKPALFLRNVAIERLRKCRRGRDRLRGAE